MPKIMRMSIGIIPEPMTTVRVWAVRTKCWVPHPVGGQSFFHPSRKLAAAQVSKLNKGIKFIPGWRKIGLYYASAVLLSINWNPKQA